MPRAGALGGSLQLNVTRGLGARSTHTTRPRTRFGAPNPRRKCLPSTASDTARICPSGHSHQCSQLFSVPRPRTSPRVIRVDGREEPCPGLRAEHIFTRKHPPKRGQTSCPPTAGSGTQSGGRPCPSQARLEGATGPKMTQPARRAVQAVPFRRVRVYVHVDTSA